jgi:type I restriction enzyme S subunit
LEESSLPFRVDLLVWDDIPESFRENIQRAYVVLVEESAGKRGVGGSEWNCIPLSELIATGRGISYGIVQPGSHQENGVPILRVSDIRDGRINVAEPLRVSTQIEAAHVRTRLRGGELLLTLVGTVGEVAVVPPELAGWNVARAVAVIPVRDDIGAYWVKLALSAPNVREMIHGRMNTTVQATLNLKDVAQLPILMPDSDVRSAISNVIGTLDDKIELNRRMNETLEAMARAIFQSWFVDFDPVRAKASGESADSICQRLGLTPELLALFPDSFEDSELGEISKGWSVTTLKGMTSKIGSGATPRGGREVYLEEGTSLIRSQNVYDAEFIWDGLAHITDEAAKQLNGVEVKAGDVLINITGASILRTCVVDPQVLPARVNQHVSIIRAKADHASRYLHLHLLQAATKAYLMGLNAGASREAVTKGHLESVPIINPGPILLEHFGATVASLYAEVDQLALQTRTLQRLRDVLLPKLLAGELEAHTSISVQGPKT